MKLLFKFDIFPQEMVLLDKNIPSILMCLHEYENKLRILYKKTLPVFANKHHLSPRG